MYLQKITLQVTVEPPGRKLCGLSFTGGMILLLRTSDSKFLDTSERIDICLQFLTSETALDLKIGVTWLIFQILEKTSTSMEFWKLS